MEKLIKLIETNESWLMQRILNYAIQQEYVKYTSTLAEAWRLSISGLSRPLLDSLHANPTVPELTPDEDYTSDPIAAFGVLEAQKHRYRGITLPMFLGLMKYYRQSYIDLLDEGDFNEVEKKNYRLYLERFFDRVELGFCSEWAAQSENQILSELQGANRFMTNEKNKYLTIFESLQSPVLLIDQNLQIENMNQAASAFLTGEVSSGVMYYAAQPLRKTVPWLKEALDLLAKTGRLENEFEKQITAGNRQGYFQVKIKRMLDVSEKFCGYVVIMNDISERKRAEDQLTYLSTHDSLTGLYNRAFLEAELARLERGRQYPISIMIIDVDNLKEINDRDGHAAGDQLLQRTAEVLRVSFRVEDIIARIGGDEFAALFTTSDEFVAQSMIDRVRDELAIHNQQVKEPILRLSLGFSTARKGISLDKALKQADNAMYQDKLAHKSQESSPQTRQ